MPSIRRALQLSTLGACCWLSLWVSNSFAASPFGPTLNLSTLSAANGFRITGVAAGDSAGWSVSDAGDVNGDGIDDFIVGAPGADVNGLGSGVAYVVFGKTGGFGTNLNLSTLNGTTGFRISGEEKGDVAGASVSAAGDVNGDGYDDLLVGASGVSTNGKGGGGGAFNTAGAAYVVFGKASGYTANLNLSTLNGANGFQLNGILKADSTGWSVSSAGDINGDGFDDVIVGAWGAGTNGKNSGAAYVVFGKAGGFAATFSASSLTGANGFRITGAPAFSTAGESISGAGDINGDNIDDLIVGSDRAAYVVFGKAGGFAANLNLSTLNGTTGFRIVNASIANFGDSVSVAGDVNGDGIDDLIVGEEYAGSKSGAAYVVFGKVGGFGATFDVSTLTGANGFRITGVAANDYAGSSVSAAGDINGDGFADLIVGAFGADPNGSQSGAAYVVFGKAGGFAPTLNLSGLTGANGFRITGVAAGDSAGSSVSAAGNVNGDGIDDLIVGASGADVNGSNSGAAYVIYGKRTDSGGGQTIIGTDNADTLTGGTGNDTISGLGGND
ncbi:MAG: FG-GAP repeat protein, partial [Aestuariivirga sp.]|uniref:beta strand repeat-containing protein n=1 Tax=Aestuariivirga sp. TaxID=2650926 RepID=UPI0025C1CD4D